VQHPLVFVVLELKAPGCCSSSRCRVVVPPFCT
jgi:hypothetical protein